MINLAWHVPVVFLEILLRSQIHYIVSEKKAKWIESGFALWLSGAITEQQNGGSFQGDELSWLKTSTPVNMNAEKVTKIRAELYWTQVSCTCKANHGITITSTKEL